MRLTVADLMAALAQLPLDARILTAGLEGIYPAQSGNLFPLKVLETPFGVAIYVDDGLGDHGIISDAWEPLI